MFRDYMENARYLIEKMLFKLVNFMTDFALLQLSALTSFVLQKLKQDTFREFLEVFPLGHYVEVLHRKVDAHPLQLHGLVHVTQVQQLDHVLQVNHGHQVLLA